MSETGSESGGESSAGAAESSGGEPGEEGPAGGESAGDTESAGGTDSAGGASAGGDSAQAGGTSAEGATTENGEAGTGQDTDASSAAEPGQDDPAGSEESDSTDGSESGAQDDAETAGNPEPGEDSSAQAEPGEDAEPGELIEPSESEPEENADPEQPVPEPVTDDSAADGGDEVGSPPQLASDSAQTDPEETGDAESDTPEEYPQEPGEGVPAELASEDGESAGDSEGSESEVVNDSPSDASVAQTQADSDRDEGSGKDSGQKMPALDADIKDAQNTVGAGASNGDIAAGAQVPVISDSAMRQQATGDGTTPINPDTVPTDSSDGQIAAERNAAVNKEIDQVLGKVNPNYERDKSAYSENCTGVVQANELQRRGIDMQARPLEPELRTDQDPPGPGGRALTVIEEPWGRTFTPGTKAEIEAAFKEPGSRGVVYIEWNNSPGAHVFNVENVGGTVRFVEGQTIPPQTDASSYFDIGGNTKYLRLDDLPTPPSSATAKYVEPRDK